MDDGQKMDGQNAKGQKMDGQNAKGLIVNTVTEKVKYL